MSHLLIKLVTHYKLVKAHSEQIEGSHHSNGKFNTMDCNAKVFHSHTNYNMEYHSEFIVPHTNNGFQWKRN